MIKRIKWLMFPLLFVVSIAAVNLNNGDRLFEISKNIEIFVNAFRELNKHYVDELDPATVMRTGIDAIVGSLDPFTNFISESQVESYRISDDAKYQGIGVKIFDRDGAVFLEEVYQGGPAYEKGLRPGDQLLSINGVSLLNKSTEEINNILRGVGGTNLTLVYIPLGSANSVELRLERGEINIPNVPYSGWVEDDIAYVSLTTFTADASANIAKALREMKNENPNLKGIILDLRDNGGGLLREAVAICNLFVKQGEEVVTTKGKDISKDQSFKTMTTPLDLETPLAVLINKRSASASEIVSGVIQDLDRGVLIGQRSYGKGLVQNYFEIGYNNRLKVTISKYYIPSGRCIQGVEYANGEPVDIPDSKRSVFKTRNGRPVLDGGGVTPDVRIEEPEFSPLTKALLEKKIIFDYVNDYILKNDSIKNVKDVKFTQYEDFIAFAKMKNFSFQLDGEKELEIFKEQLATEASSLEEVTSIEKKIQDLKSQYFLKYKDEIILEIEKELVLRYLFQKGLIQYRLDKDPEIKEAISILKDEDRYKKILGIKTY